MEGEGEGKREGEGEGEGEGGQRRYNGRSVGWGKPDKTLLAGG